MMKQYLCIILLLLFAIGHAQNKQVSFNNPTICYESRIRYRTDAAELIWPGTNVTISFEGTRVSAVLKDLDTANYYNVIVDGKVIQKIHTDTVKRTYVLASDLPRRKHTVQLFKRTEWDKGTTLFYGFEFPKNTKIIPTIDTKKRKMEFYGNSITCGYAVEDTSGKDSWFGYFQNNYVTYAAITARHYNAQYYCIAKSGIGIMLSWFPLIMPEMYDRLDPNNATSKWDFSQYTPDVVVIDLFQNDSWLVNKHEHEQFKNRFGATPPDEGFIIASYKNFLISLRQKYPNAFIICTLGNMDATMEGSRWTSYVQKAVDQMHDAKLYTHFFPFKGTSGHPSVEEQKAMASSLIHFIDKTISW